VTPFPLFGAPMIKATLLMPTLRLLASSEKVLYDLTYGLQHLYCALVQFDGCALIVLLFLFVEKTLNLFMSEGCFGNAANICKSLRYRKNFRA
jgi:hypothetical protein